MKSKLKRKSGALFGYAAVLSELSGLLEGARHTAARSINTVITATYWEIGRRIVHYEQHGADRARYGVELLERLAHDLSKRFGRGFGRENLRLMRLFYLAYADIQISQTASGKSLK